MFCAEHLDIGTRFFLQHLPDGSGARRIVDLGCGNGVVGTSAALTHPDAEILFTDESHQAVASARATYAANAGDRPGGAVFQVGDGLAEAEPDSVDLVLNNPPFTRTRRRRTRRRRGCSRRPDAALAPGGELWVVGAGTSATTSSCAACSATVNSSRATKFVVLKAVKRPSRRGGA